MSRILAASSLIGWPVLAFAVAQWQPHVKGYDALVLIAGVVAFIAVMLRNGRHARAATLVLGPALALACVAVFVARDAGHHAAMSSDSRDDVWTTIDLTRQPWPAGRLEFAEVRGYLRPQWTLAEYAVAAGERPDETGPAEAMLVPLVGSTGDVLASAGPVVVARVAPTVLRTGEELVTLRGLTTPLDPSLLEALVATQGLEHPEGVLLDTLAPRDSSTALWQLAIALLIAIVAAIALVVSLPRQMASESRSR